MLNIIVLTRKEMNGSPINRILAGMAVADILLIIEYLPFLIGREFWQSDDHNMTWGWSAYMWFHSNFRLVYSNIQRIRYTDYLFLKHVLFKRMEVNLYLLVLSGEI